MKPDIIYEDEYMIAVVKPYGVSSQPDSGSGEDMMTTVKNYLYDRSSPDEEPYLAVINRLDRPVAGIVLYAKTREVASRLSELLQNGGISKYYQAVVTGFMKEPEGELEDYLLFDKKENVSSVVSAETKGAKKAVLTYEVLDELDTDEGPVSYLLIELLTGRHHQIRCQLANAGCGIWGDVKYNPQFHQKPVKGQKKAGRKRINGIGLYSSMMEFTHPVTGEDITLHREPEGEAFEIIDQVEW